MSAIIAILRLDDRPVEAADVRRLLEPLLGRGPDGSWVFVDGPAGLGHAALRCTPEAPVEPRPVLDPRHRLAISFDGRLDNRAELGGQLGIGQRDLAALDDPELVLRAYTRWGTAAVSRLLGDFAFGVWDGERNRLWCARDHLGVKPLYYLAAGRVLVAGSTMAAVAAHRSTGRQPNLGMVAELLANQVVNLDETLLAGVRRLPPAHELLVEHGAVHVRRYWELEPRDDLPSSEEGCIEAFAAAFGEAVRCRLRATGPVGVELSGGLDSSSVTGVAGRVLAEEGASSRLETFSLTFPGQACDEAPYIDEVVRHSGCGSNRLPQPSDADERYLETLAHRHLDFPGYPISAINQPLRALATERGCRVVLSGAGGDELLAGASSQLADLVGGLRLASAVQAAKDEAAEPGADPAWRLLWERGARPVLTGFIPRRLKRRLKPTSPPPWITPAFAREAGWAERVPASSRRRLATRAQQHVHDLVTGPRRVHFFEVHDRVTADSHQEQRHPFYDARVVELGLALDDGLRRRGEDTKYALRQAMRGIIPELVRTRRTKADFSHVFAWELRSPARRRMLEDLEVERRGWVDGDVVRDMHARMCHLYECGWDAFSELVWPLWMVLGVELWCRAVL